MKEKLQEYALLAEVISAIAIVISLIFVGLQIQEGNRETRAATIQAISDQNIEYVLAMATDMHQPRLINEMVINGITSADLSPEDNTRLRLAIIAGMRRQENLFLQVQSGILEPEALQSVSFNYYRTPYVREFWLNNREFYDQEFARYWDGVIAE